MKGLGGRDTRDCEHMTPGAGSWERALPGDCGHVTPVIGFGVWDHRGDWSFETLYRFWEVVSRWRWDM